MAISNKEYIEASLKPVIKEKEIDLKTIINLIPGEELKKYLLSQSEKNSVTLTIYSLTSNFRKYYPKQKYDFYYNNLYNSLIINSYKKDTLVNEYIEKARQYINSSEFEEVFKIIKSMIESYHDSDKLNSNDEVFDIISKLGILLRITNRKSTKATKEKITKWSTKLENNNYYDNYYLEDLILSLK